MNTSETKKAVSRILRVLDLFRSLNADMPIGEVVSFLKIYEMETLDGGGLTVTELGLHGGFSLASSSRHSRSLSKHTRKGELGHEVVTNMNDPTNARRKILRVSPKGQRIIFNINRILEV